MPATIVAAGVALTGVTISATAATAISGFLASTALSLVTTAIQGGFEGRDTIAQERRTALTAEVSSDISTRFFGLGEMMVRQDVGADVVFAKSASTGDLWRVIVFDCGSTNQVKQHFLNKEAVTLDNDGWVTAPAKWANNIRIKTYTGANPQTADADLISAFPNVWTSAHRGDGLSYVIIQQKPVSISAFTEAYPNGARGENWSAIIEASDEIYDPRDSSTGYSENAILCLMHVLLHDSGGGMDLTDLSLGSWKEAATVCDTIDVGPDGLAKARYRVSGQWEATTPGQGLSQLLDTYNALMAACNARFFYDPTDEGKLGVVVDQPDTLADMPLDANHVLSVKITKADNLLQGVEATNASFVNPRLGFNGDVTPHYPTTVSSPKKIRTVPLKYVPDRTQAFRLAKFSHIQRSADTVVDLKASIAGALLRPAGVATFDMVEIPDGNYMIEDIERGAADQPTTEIEAWQIDEDWGVFDGSSELTAEDLPTATTTDGVKIDDPTDFCIGSSDGAGTLRGAWLTPGETGMSIEWGWAETGSGVFEFQTTYFPADDRTATLDATGATGNVDVRARFNLLTGGSTDWVTVSNIDPDTLLSAPTAPTISDLVPTFDLNGGSVFGGDGFNASWTASECVYLVRVFVEKNVNPPTAQVGTNSKISDSEYPFLLQTGAVSGCADGDTVYVQIEVENVSGQTTKSSVSSIAITDTGGGE